VPAQIRRQMSLIGVARVGCELSETSMSKRNLPQRIAESLDGGISLGRKPGAAAKMALQRAGNHADGSGERGNAGATIRYP
jgi:hypothetical protein